MRKGILLGFVLLALVAGAGASPSPGLRPLVLGSHAKEERVLAFRFGFSTARLVRLDASTLRPLPGRTLALGRHSWPWSFSPDGSQLVVADSRLGELLFVDPVAFRPLGTMRITAGNPSTIVWLGTYLLVLTEDGEGGTALVTIDAAARHVVSTAVLAGQREGTAQTPSSLVLLLGPEQGLGPSTLLVVLPDGSSRSAPLDRIVSGFERPRLDQFGQEVDPRQILHSAQPGLAVDSAGEKAYVVAAGAPVAEIDLATLAVSYHDLSRPASLVGRVRDWLEPAAQAKSPPDGPERTATWLGDGILGVGGSEAQASLNANGEPQGKQWPTGVQLIDTHDWSSHMLDAGGSSLAVGDGLLLVSGYTWESSSDSATGMGLTGYGPDRAPRFHLFGTSPVSVQVVGDRALVRPWGEQSPTWLVDLGTGALLRQVKDDLLLLTRPSD